ncbi:MAG: hypothetical protein AMXMBFR56_72970 [Polyangiaceae bacterium]
MNDNARRCLRVAADALEEEGDLQAAKVVLALALGHLRAVEVTTRVGEDWADLRCELSAPSSLTWNVPATPRGRSSR